LQGFAFLNFVSHSAALQARELIRGLHWSQQGRRCDVRWAEPELQGLEANVERYRSSPVMHESVAESHRPVLFSAGVRVSFPKPTKRIRAPRLRGPHVGQRVLSSPTSAFHGRAMRA
jgi:hypothetical protein